MSNDGMGKMIMSVPRPARPEGDFRRMADPRGDGGQEVPHQHFHSIGGPRPWQGRVAPTV